MENLNNPNSFIKSRLGMNGVQTENIVVESKVDENDKEYRELLDDVQQYIVQNKLPELTASFESGDTETIRNLVDVYMKRRYTKLSKDEKKYQLYYEKVIEDMVGFGFLSKYFNIKDQIEEININAWDCVEVRWCDGRDEITDDKFLSPENAKDVMTRILKQTGRYLDDNRIYDVTYIGKAIRLTVVTSPIVDAEIGVAASIRFIHSAVFDLETMVKEDFLTQEMSDALKTFVN
ncbi:MAG: Flp pilus assembly complex ATPase component TadA, partial [Clostridiales bacterium]|nr:Flp pilus assembly complex ATPase component TadA [Candidatus Coliplasma equi]